MSKSKAPAVEPAQPKKYAYTLTAQRGGYIVETYEVTGEPIEVTTEDVLPLALHALSQKVRKVLGL